MKFITISDTHGKHNELILPSGDVLIHAGDVSSRGTINEVTDFLNWFKRQDFEHKIFIAGNHDFFFERESTEVICSLIPDDVIYLDDSGVTINGFKIWGSPITPWFHDWAFNRNRGADIKQYWDLIPENTSLLITHGPAYGMLDRTVSAGNVGCVDLYNRICEIKPKVHICGHIHEAYGELENGETKFINASILNEKYKMKNEPIVFEF